VRAGRVPAGAGGPLQGDDHACLRINGWLWGRGHRQAPLDDHGSLGDAARILVSAPRRAGLVACDADYPYWRSAWPVDGQDMAERGGGDA
jgi:hypothetical protein